MVRSLLLAAVASMVICVASGARAEPPDKQPEKKEKALTKLPFGFKFSKTTRKELATRGLCDTSGNGSCKKYFMAGGKFEALLNDNDTLMTLTFSLGHELPQAWRDLGLKLAPLGESSGANDGTAKPQFLAILKDQGATSIQERIEKAEQYHSAEIHFDRVVTVVSFRIDDIQYTSRFFETQPRPGNTYAPGNRYVGLTYLDLTEGY